MPIYEYRCTRCGKQVEVLQKINDRPLRRCTECSGTLEKLVSRSSIQFKGTGWYVTDYGKSSGSKEGEGGSKEGEGGGKADEAGGKDQSAKTASGKESPPTKATKAKGSTSKRDD